MERTRTCFFTGHRKIAADKQKYVSEKIEEYVENLIIQYDVKNFICGGAIGFDTIAADTVLEMKKMYPHIRLFLYLPCRDQSKLWLNDDKEKYNSILSQADEVLYVTDGTYSKECMHKRNLKMVQDSFFCIAFCIAERSGSGFTVRNAAEAGKKIFNIADELYN